MGVVDAVAPGQRGGHQGQQLVPGVGPARGVAQVNEAVRQFTQTQAEGSSVMVKVTLSADPERTVTVPLTKANQGGASGAQSWSPTATGRTATSGPSARSSQPSPPPSVASFLPFVFASVLRLADP